MKPITYRYLFKFYFYLSILTLITGCDAGQTNSPAPLVEGNPYQPTNKTDRPRSHGLTIYGYNYTDLPISTFSVDGSGGGNLVASTPTSSGGSAACCYTLYSDSSVDTTVNIRWLSSIGRMGNEFWCEQDVPLKQLVPDKPEYLEVHFYQDGHIELEVTEDASPPRLKLTTEIENGTSRYADYSKNVNNAKKYSKCERLIVPSEDVGSQIAYVALQAGFAAVAKQKALDKQMHKVFPEKYYDKIDQEAYNLAWDKEDQRVRAMSQEEFDAYERYADEQGKLRSKAAAEEYNRYLDASLNLKNNK